MNNIFEVGSKFVDVFNGTAVWVIFKFKGIDTHLICIESDGTFSKVGDEISYESSYFEYLVENVEEWKYK